MDNTILLAFTAATLGLTVLAALTHGLMWCASSILAWLIWTFVAANAVFPEGNTYLVTAVGLFGVFMTIVMIMLLASRIADKVPREPTHAEIRDRHRRRILNITSPHKQLTYREMPRIPYPQIDKEERRRRRGKEEDTL